MPSAVKLSRREAIAPGSIVVVSEYDSLLIPLQPSSPENSVNRSGGMESPAFWNSTE